MKHLTVQFSCLMYLYFPLKAEDSERFKTIVQFECRGLEPVDFQPQVGCFIQKQNVLFSLICKSLRIKCKSKNIVYRPNHFYNFSPNLTQTFIPQAGFAAKGAETSTQFPEINLLEKVSNVYCIVLYSPYDISYTFMQ